MRILLAGRGSGTSLSHCYIAKQTTYAGILLTSRVRALARFEKVELR